MTRIVITLPGIVEANRKLDLLLQAGGIVVPPTPLPIAITGTPPLTGRVGQPYSFTPITSYGSGMKVFALIGTLRAGLFFSTDTGAITGTPTAAGTMTGLSVTVTDDTGSASTTPTTVTIAAGTIALQPITGSGALIAGTPSSGTITGKTAGSTLTTTIPGLTITGSSYTFDGTGAAGSYAITETLAGATNSPNPTQVVVQAAGSSGGVTWTGVTWTGVNWGGGGGTTPSITLSVGSVTSAAEGTPSNGITLSVGSITSQPEGTPSSGITLSVGSITNQAEGS